MGVRETLTLDHFYFNLFGSDFEDLLKLSDYFRGFRHSKTEVQGDSWEGIYLYSRPSSYLEILKNRRIGGFFSICLSPAYPMSCDASKIVEEVESNWHVYKRVFPGGQPWFDGYYLEEIADTHNSLFQIWIMKHHPLHKPHSQVMSPRSVDRFRQINLELGEANAEEVLRQLRFVPIPPNHTQKNITLRIPDRDGFIFTVNIDLKPGNSRFDFQSLDFDHCDPEHFHDFKRLDLNSFELTSNGKLLTLRKK